MAVFAVAGSLAHNLQHAGYRSRSTGCSETASCWFWAPVISVQFRASRPQRDYWPERVGAAWSPKPTFSGFDSRQVSYMRRRYGSTISLTTARPFATSHPYVTRTGTFLHAPHGWIVTLGATRALVNGA